jgi:hypothetical protein
MEIQDVVCAACLMSVLRFCAIFLDGGGTMAEGAGRFNPQALHALFALHHAGYVPAQMMPANAAPVVHTLIPRSFRI